MMWRFLTTAFFLVTAGLWVGQTSQPAATDEEFVGPFPSWANVKARYGAVGDGRADDTLAIQHGLDDLGQPGRSPVLFLPAGTYRITKTLVLTSSINVSIVGEDPATTLLICDGKPVGTMMWLNGIAYSRFASLTVDGLRRASFAVDP